MEKPPFQLRLKRALNQPVGKLAIFVTGATVGLGGWMACCWGNHWASSIILMGFGGIGLSLGDKLNDWHERQTRALGRSRPPT